jgi:hypothetical protein
MEIFPGLKQSITSPCYDVGLLLMMPWAKHLMQIIYLMGAGASHLYEGDNFPDTTNPYEKNIPFTVYRGEKLKSYTFTMVKLYFCVHHGKFIILPWKKLTFTVPTNHGECLHPQMFTMVKH